MAGSSARSGCVNSSTPRQWCGASRLWKVVWRGRCEDGAAEMGRLCARGNLRLAAVHRRSPRLHVARNLFLVERWTELPTQQGLEFEPGALVTDDEDEGVSGAPLPGG